MFRGQEGASLPPHAAFNIFKSDLVHLSKGTSETNLLVSGGRLYVDVTMHLVHLATDQYLP